MAQQRVHFREHYDNLKPQRVFQLFSDHERFGKLLGMPVKRIKDSPTGGNPNGVGSVRRLAGGPFAFEETVLVSEAPKRIEYTVSRGGPVKNHHGRIQFARGRRGGTDLVYTIEFDPRIPLTGGVIAFTLRQAIGAALKRVPKHA